MKKEEYIIRVYGRAVWVLGIKVASYGKTKYSVSYTSLVNNAKQYSSKSFCKSTIKLLNEDLKPLQFEIDTIK